MVEGLTVIAAGLLVVLCIILAMFAFIEAILKFDQVLSNRTERARKRGQARQEQAAPAAKPEASPQSDELMAAIGVALYQHLALGKTARSAAATPSSTPTPWVSSGRLDIMRERQRATSRRG